MTSSLARGWKLKDLAILVGILGFGFGLLGVPATVLLAILCSPLLMVPQGRKRSAFFGVMVCFLPVLLIGVYFTWFTSWALIGHVPRLYLHDSKYIAGLEGPSNIVRLFLLTSPFAFALSTIIAVSKSVVSSKDERHWFTRSYLLLLYPEIVFISYGTVLRDPFRVFNWFMD